MTSTVRVNFHCHSIFSDGDQTPEALAVNFSRAGVRFASLTDHDTLEGLPRFMEAAQKHGVLTLPGLELTTWHEGAEIHILAYGFDSENLELLSLLHDLRQGQTLEVHSIAGSLRKKGTNTSNHEDEVQTEVGRNKNKLSTVTAIEMIHRAGGKTFLAHPFASIPDSEKLESTVILLKSRGLDGIEVFYDPFTSEQRNELFSLAEKLDLFSSAGTDIHTNNGVFSIEFPKTDWKKFRNAVISGQHSKPKAEILPGIPEVKTAAKDLRPIKKQPFRTRAFIIRILLPTIIAIGLFLGAIWGILLPSFENTLVDRKRELIRELTNSAWSILSSYEQDVRSGELDLAEAQGLALDRIEALRYGPESKDYFWVQDLVPTMLMHPYRPDLNGQDVSSFKDARGVPIFVEFANLVQRNEQGYINYVWQWKDDPARLEPKQSYVKGFKPWGWVIGTGIYTDDVNLEIAKIERSIVNTSLIISGAVILLLLYVVTQSMKIDRERQEVVNTLQESTARYHSLIEATTEGTLLVIDDRCRYANPTFQKMTGFSSHHLEFMDLGDLVPRISENTNFWQRFEKLTQKGLVEHEEKMEIEGLDGILAVANGRKLDCVFILNPVEYAGQRGLILLAKEISPDSKVLVLDLLAQAAQTSPIGIFRARVSKELKIVAMNPTARQYFKSAEASLEDLFLVNTDFEQLLNRIKKGESIQNQIIKTCRKDGSELYLSLSTAMLPEVAGQAASLSGTLQDITSQFEKNLEIERELQLKQTALLFLHQPLGLLEKKYLQIDSNTTMAAAAETLVGQHALAAVVIQGGETLGIVTLQDLSTGWTKSGTSKLTPVTKALRPQTKSISETALVYEALIYMENKNISTLAVIDANGLIVNLVGHADLIRFQNYGLSLQPDIISGATDAATMTKNTQRTALLAKTMLENSARPSITTRIISSVCDAATQKMIDLATRELGPAPSPFVFIGMGSQGRMEQTLLTDQDNGIIYLNAGGIGEEVAQGYFLELGRQVCQGLEAAGYPYCTGGVMANNPKWCRPLPDWIAGFKQGVREPEPQDIIDLNIFLDFRPVFGDSSISRQLRSEINHFLISDPSIFNFLAREALTSKLPSRSLAGISLGGASGEHLDEINLKDVMMPIVFFARLYALRHQINQTHTLERIQALVDQGVISSKNRDELFTVYDFLMQTRLQVQMSAIEHHQLVTNRVRVNQLGYMQREQLKQSLIQIEAIQKKISYDFLGGLA